MLVYGGYRDLRGSSNELWAFHFGTLCACIVCLCVSERVSRKRRTLFLIRLEPQLPLRQARCSRIYPTATRNLR